MELVTPHESFIYFLHPNGDVIGKRFHPDTKLGLPEDQWKRYIKMGYKPCGADGKLKNKKKKAGK